jgi:uncharacterized membrane protein YphA (DoxX/SURF4 family)
MALAAVSLRFILASVFLVAGFAKLLSSDEFALAVQNYDLLPARASVVVARVLPALEIGCAVLLLLGLGIRPVSAVLALLLLVFAGAVAVNLARGREIDCGCFGASTERRLSRWTVVRNVALAAAAVVVAVESPAALALDRVFELGRVGGVGSSEAIAVALASAASLAGFALGSQALRLRRVLNLVVNARAAR